MLRICSSVLSVDICVYLDVFRKKDPQHHFGDAWLHNLVIWYLTVGQLGCFQFPSLIYKATRNIPVHEPLAILST